MLEKLARMVRGESWNRSPATHPPESQVEMAGIPEGWTDDLNIPLPPGRSEGEVVDFVFQAALREMPDDEIEQLLANEFHLAPDDAALARDRAFGGLVRAGTRDPRNCPNRSKDPLAWESYQRGKRDPSLIARLCRKH